uniref:UDP-N-acetylglucosamine diphosphorylase n=1 Tax=Auxenochlorella protothecoides TaxID=3075 RepID=A0A1D2A1J4_AUXPR
MGGLEAALRTAGQGHLWDHLLTLDGEVRTAFQVQLEAVDFARVQRIFQASVTMTEDAEEGVEPIDGVQTIQDTTEEQRGKWRALGLAAIAGGRVAGLLLAGGQGTRLGSPAPKGCYDIGLPSRKSLFRLHAERLLRLQQLAQREESAPRPCIPWYIMTSPATDVETRAFFQAHAWFGLDAEQVFFFQQGELPALTPSGEAILAAPGRLALSPDGNGGVYAALRRSGALADMAARGVAALDVWPVDNALAAPLDPAWVGACLAARAELGCRVLQKAAPGERVGVLARRGGRLAVLEYSELSEARAAARNPSTGALRYAWSNACLHFFSLAWLARATDALEAAPRFHVARKAVPCLGGGTRPGVKLELFIFDTFGLAEGVRLVEVDRAAQFAPVKNGPGAGSDCPETAREAVLALHAGWVRRAGGRVGCGEGVEVSPLLSYAGEGLEDVCGGQDFTRPWDARLQLVGGDKGGQGLGPSGRRGGHPAILNMEGRDCWGQMHVLHCRMG